MAKFIPPPDQINSIAPKKTKKSFSDNSSQSIFSEIKKVIKDSFTSDAFEQVGAMNAVVLEVREVDVISMLWRNPLMFWQFMNGGSIPDYIEIRFRIPEMHAHLPEPEGPDDWLAINLHPLAIMKKNKGAPVPGDIVTLDFQDKNNFRGAVVIETLNTNDPNKNPGGNCSPSATHGSAAPPLNMSSPPGDNQTSSPEEYSAPNAPASEGRTQGISYPDPNQSTGGSFFSDTVAAATSSPDVSYEILDPTTGAFTTFYPKKSKHVIYFVNIEESQTFSDFKNVDNVVPTLLSKKVAAVCISVAEGNKRLRNVRKIKKIIKNLVDSNIDVGLSMNIKSSDQFHDNFVYMADIAKSLPIKFVVYDVADIPSEADRVKFDQIYLNFVNSMSIKYYSIISDQTNLINRCFMPSAEKHFVSRNNFNNNDTFNGFSPRYDAVPDVTDIGVDYTNTLRAMYYLGGINFIGTPNKPCDAGERTAKQLEREIKTLDNISTSPDYMEEHQVMITNYEFLNEDKSVTIAKALGLTEEYFSSTEKQNFLSSLDNTKKTDKTKVTDVVGTVADIVLDEPSFNSGSSASSGGTTASSFGSTGGGSGGGSGGGGSQTPEATPAAESAAKPGMQCTPIPTVQPNAAGTGPGGGGGDSAAVEPPSFRFDSLENYQNLGWTANNSAAINNVIFDFMEKFSAAVYRRLPQNSASFTGSNPKKIRLTSTARTFEKQASLMWDKIKNGGGDQAVYGLYGKKEWTTAVVNAYHAQNFDAAVAAVEKRVNAGGGSAHLKGKGVDVHTWSHINAEGMNSDGATVAQMNNSKFVQAVVEAAKEVGASPVVEAYQQHVHITIF